MTLPRPLFLAFLLAGIAAPVFAADKTQSETSSNSSQSTAYDGTAQTLTDPSGLMFSVAEPRTLNHPPVARLPIAKLDDGVCYTMRMYKLKRTERISDGETTGRGYATCEMASNYQFRSAIAHARIDDSAGTREK